MRTRQRPGGATAIAIINIILGSLGLLLGICAVIVLLVGTANLVGAQDPIVKQMEERVAREIPSYQVIQWLSSALFLIVAVGGLLSGIGLLSNANWGRVLGLLTGWLGVVYSLSSAVLQIIVSPIQRRALDEAPPGMREAMKMGANVGMIIGILIMLLIVGYAVTMIIVLMKPRIRDFYTSAEGAFADEQDQHGRGGGEDWYDRRRDPYEYDDRPPPPPPSGGEDDRFRRRDQDDYR